MLGTAIALSGCAKGYDDLDERVSQEVRQNSYSSKQDCEKDWGEKEKQECQPRKGGGYAGPRYFYNHGSSTPMIVGNDGSTRAAANSFVGRPGYVSTSRATTSHTTSIARGGFGGTGRGFSAGG